MGSVIEKKESEKTGMKSVKPAKVTPGAPNIALPQEMKGQTCPLNVPQAAVRRFSL